MKMNTKRTVAITLVLLMAASAVGTLSVVAAPAPASIKSTQLSIATTNSDLFPNQRFAVYGRLMSGTASVKGQTITLSYSTDGGTTWTTVAEAITTYYGGYSYYSSGAPLQFSQTRQEYKIKADFAGNEDYAASSSEVTVVVSPYTPNISVYTNVAQPVSRQPFTVYGWVKNPAGRGIPGMPVIIFVIVADYDGNWNDFYLGLGQTDANGRYLFTKTLFNAGYAIIYIATDDTWNEYASYGYYVNNGNTWLTISQAPTHLSIYSSANPHPDKPFTIYGLLTNTLTKERLANEPGLTLSYSTNGVDFNSLADPVSTNANGQYAFSVMLPSGDYQFKVNFPGDGNYLASYSPLLNVHVA